MHSQRRIVRPACRRPACRRRVLMVRRPVFTAEFLRRDLRRDPCCPFFNAGQHVNHVREYISNQTIPATSGS